MYIAESQNESAQKGPPEVIYSDPLLKASLIKPGCSDL